MSASKKKNTGYQNTGYRNTGYQNTGDWPGSRPWPKKRRDGDNMALPKYTNEEYYEDLQAEYERRMAGEDEDPLGAPRGMWIALKITCSIWMAAVCAMGAWSAVRTGAWEQWFVATAFGVMAAVCVHRLEGRDFWLKIGLAIVGLVMFFHFINLGGLR